MKKIPFVTDVLELYTKTIEGLPLWKTKGKILTFENLLDDIFVISSDLAEFFSIRHDHLVSQNIAKLQKRGHLPERLPNFREPYVTGNSTMKSHLVYALTREQTEHLIMEFSGPKASEKKHTILHRLHLIERDVAKGSYQEARMKIQDWDGVQLLQDLGFQCSLPNGIATKKDITAFLKVPESTLNYFLSKYRDEIKPIALDGERIEAVGSKARHMNGYSLEDVTKITLGMDTEVGIEAKRKILGNLGAFFKTQAKEEIQWREVLSRVFAGFDLRYNHPVGKYRVDFFVPPFMLVLECNGYSHRFYNPEEEKERERAILQKYALVRFHHKISLERLVNGILQAKPGRVIRLKEADTKAGVWSGE